MVGILPDSAFALAAVKADDGRGGWRRSMNTIGVLLLAAATAGDGFGYSKPGVGFKKLLRPHVVSHGAPPAGGMIQPGAGMGDMGPGGPEAGRRFPNTKSQIYFL